MEQAYDGGVQELQKYYEFPSEEPSSPGGSQGESSKQPQND